MERLQGLRPKAKNLIQFIFLCSVVFDILKSSCQIESRRLSFRLEVLNLFAELLITVLFQFILAVMCSYLVYASIYCSALLLQKSGASFEHLNCRRLRLKPLLTQQPNSGR